MLFRDALPATEAVEPAAAPRPLRLPVAEEATARTAPRSYRLGLPTFRPRMWAGWAAAACVAVGAFVGWRALHREPAPVAAVTQPAGPAAAVRVVSAGPGLVIDAPGGTRAVGADAAVAPDEQLRTTVTPAVLGFGGENTRVELAPRTTVTFAGGLSKRFDLLSGRLDCRVAKQTPGRPLVILTPHAQVTVVGTRFDVTAAGDWSRVQVSEGTVRVLRRSDGATVDVSGGQFVDVPGVEARPPRFAAKPAGRDMSPFWSVQVLPAGIDQ